MADIANQGWIKLHRKIMDSQVWANPHLYRLWSYCLMMANHRKTFVMVEGVVKPVEIQPGQFITGRFSLHKALYPKKDRNWKSPKTAWRYLETLQDMRNLTIKTTNRFSIVTICNWGVYQTAVLENDQANDQQLTNSCPTVDQQLTTNKKVKKETLCIPPELQKVWWNWLAYWEELKRPLTIKTQQGQLKRLQQYDPAVRIEMIETAIECGWRKLWPLNRKPRDESRPTAKPGRYDEPEPPKR